ncbi:MAG TPA: hypothetical protein P5295_16545, partial [Spirochaetota bacterium]|nr:hypothetical protein [Spirochaetota bacterium]
AVKLMIGMSSMNRTINECILSLFITNLHDTWSVPAERGVTKKTELINFNSPRDFTMNRNVAVPDKYLDSNFFC